MFRCLFLCIATVLYLAVDASSAVAQVTVVAGVNRDTVTVGDPVTLRLRIRRSAESAVVLLPANGFPGQFEVREQRPPVVREREDHQVEEVRDYVLVAYRTGVLEIPPLTVQVETPGGKVEEYASGPLSVVVRSVRPPGENDIRDVKPPVAVEARIPVWAWVAVAGLFFIVAALIWYVRYRRRKPVVAPPPPPVDWSVEVEKIVRMGLLEKGAFKEYYTLLSEVARRFLEARLGVEAMERTTFEVVRDLRQVSVDAEAIDDVEAFLSEADLVKFAKFRPAEGNGRGAAKRIHNLVKRVEARQMTSDSAIVHPESVTGVNGC